MLSLLVWDLDDTLFTSEGVIDVYDKENGQLVETITTDEFRKRQYPPHYRYCYSRLNNAAIFERTAEPISDNIALMCKQINAAKQIGTTDIIILTARNTFDDMVLFKSVLEKHGIDTDYVRIFFSGDYEADTTAESKAVVMQKFLDKNIYETISMYDDDYRNLRAVQGLLLNNIDVQFFPYIITNGKIDPYVG